MQKYKPFSKKETKRLFRVCDVIKHSLLGDISCSYELLPTDDTALASSFIFNSGWRGKIAFYNSFFDLDLQTQIETIVHEFVHLMMQPVDQQILRLRRLIQKKDQPFYEETLHVAREIAVDRAAGNLTKLLMPAISKAL